ncbi:MAG: tetratricopeptide (TPR) repeat protein [Bacteriovoracaceae bacterium]|jgi:tetratricopeptide (TPR) repeat protein
MFRMGNLLVFLMLFPALSQGSVARAEKIYFTKGISNRNEAVTYELMRSKYYFSATVFAKERLIEDKPFDERFEKSLTTLILKTGTATFMPLSSDILGKHNSQAMSFVLGIKEFNKNRFKSAIKALRNIKRGHKFGPEKYMMMGASQNFLARYSEATSSYKNCMRTAEVSSKASSHEKLKRYYDILAESCLIHLARMEYKRNDYKKAVQAFQDIPKTSYRWPALLLEKAWGNYYLADYNRTLGLLVTYKSPLLKSYFYPEAEVLTALSYYRLCLYDDALKTIEQYHNVYKARSDALKGILVKYKKSHTFFLKMMMQPIEKLEEKNPFIRNLMTQTRKKIKFNLDLANYKKVSNEYKYLKKKKQSQFISKLTEAVKRSKDWQTRHLNHYIKKEMFDFLNDVHRFSYEMFNIKLEIMFKKRDLLYKNKTLISDRGRGSIDNLNRSQSEHFYDFRGAFWADELGDYSFGLKSNCEEVKAKKNGGGV